MRIPVIQGVIDRRMLVNFRVDPQVIARQLPQPFRPKLHNGHGMAGICLIRLRQLRPRFLPGFVGVSSENAAHRIAVEWDSSGGVREGVFIPRRDTSSRLNVLLGGRIFPGEHHRARFRCIERDDSYEIAMQSADDRCRVQVKGRVAQSLPRDSIFGSLDDASKCFERGALGYSVSRQPHNYQGLELRCTGWNVQALEVGQVQSSYFEDSTLFPKGSMKFDCALLMRNIQHQWHARETLCGETDARLANQEFAAQL